MPDSSPGRGGKAQDCRVRCLLLRLGLLLWLLACAWGSLVLTAVAQLQSARPTPTPETGPAEPLSAQSTGTANLVVEGISVWPKTAQVGSTVNIRVTVANRGSALPTNSDGYAANFFLDLFVSPPVTGAEDLLTMPGYPPTLTAGLQSFWLPPGDSYTVAFTYAFSDSGVYSLYAVVDTVELGLPFGNVNEGGAAGEADNAFGPEMVEARYANVLVAKDGSDFARGPASSLAMVGLPAETSGEAVAEGLEGQTLVFGDTALTLGFFEEPPYGWGLTDPLTPDYEMYGLDQRLSGEGADGPQEWPRLAAKDGLLVAVWQDRRNSQLTDWDIYLTWSTDQGDTWRQPNVRVNDDEVGAGDQRRPAVAISPIEDRVLVVWQDSRRSVDNPNGLYRILGQWYVLSGSDLVPDGSNFAVSSALDVNSLGPDVATGPEGNFYVVWQDDRAGNSDIWLRAHSSSGWMSSPRRVTDDLEGTNQRSPRVAAGRTEVLRDWATAGCPDGLPVFVLTTVEKDPLVVVWEDDRLGDWDVFMSYSVDQAQTFTVDRRVNDDEVANGVAQRQPVVGVAQMWEERELEDKDEVCPVPGTTGIVSIPAAAFYMAWQDFRASSDDAKSNNPDIYLARFEGTAQSASPLDLETGGNERVSAEEAAPVWQEYPALVCRTYPGSLFADEQARHNAFVAWSEWRNYGAPNSDLYLAVRGDGGLPLPSYWTEGVIQLNSGAHAVNLAGSSYLKYDTGDPPPAHQVRPSLATDITRALYEPEDLGIWWHQGYLYAAWDDNRLGGYERDVYFTRSNMTYFAGYQFYPSPLRNDQLPVGGTCRYGSGSYVSPIYDMGPAGVVWDRIEWNAVTPSGTYLTLQTRVGDDPDNLGQWMPKTFPYAILGLPELGAPIQGYDTPGQMIVGPDGQERPTSRYIQYRVNMWAWPLDGPVANAWGEVGDVPTVYDPVASTPVLYSVRLHYEGGLTDTFLPMVLRH